MTRSRQSITLTPAGQKLYPYAVRILATSDEAETALSDLAHQVHGIFRIGSSLEIGPYLLPEALALITRQFPLLRASARIRSPRELTIALRQGDLDLVIAEELPAAKDRPHLAVQALQTDEVVFVVPADHPLSTCQEIPLAALVDLPLLIREDAEATESFWAEQLKGRGVPLHELRIAHVVGDTEGLKRGILAGLGYGFAARCALEYEVRAGSLLGLRITGLELRRWIWLMVHEHPNKQVEAIRQLLTAGHPMDRPPALVAECAAPKTDYPCAEQPWNDFPNGPPM